MNRLAYGCKTWAVVSGVILLGLWWMAGFSAFVEAREGGASVDLATAVARVARENIPALVHIEVIERQEMVNPFLPFESDPFFRYSLDFPRRSRKFESELNGLGTGMIMDDWGHILSNHHVVGQATEIRVLVAGGKRYPAYLVGSDPKTDLAVIQIVAGEALPHVVFGDSDEVEVGDWVVAIGHPQGMDHTVAQGIIIAKHRKGIWDPSSYRDFLRTDAVINPGNSGGPLLNLHGKVIGVNTAIVSQSREFEGIGFAIPSNMALHIAGKLIAFGEVERGWLGVSAQDLAPEMAESLGLATSKGALIADVVETGPADRAGIKRGDVVNSISGRAHFGCKLPAQRGGNQSYRSRGTAHCRAWRTEAGAAGQDREAG